MMSPQEVIDTYYLDHRCQLLEVAAFLDRYTSAAEREGGHASDTQKLDTLRDAMLQLVGPPPAEGHAARLLELFARV